VRVRNPGAALSTCVRWMIEDYMRYLNSSRFATIDDADLNGSYFVDMSGCFDLSKTRGHLLIYQSAVSPVNTRTFRNANTGSRDEINKDTFCQLRGRRSTFPRQDISIVGKTAISLLE
jgi:hypothetical protein